MKAKKNELHRGELDEATSNVAFLSSSIGGTTWLSSIIFSAILYLFVYGFDRSVAVMVFLTAISGAAIVIPGTFLLVFFVKSFERERGRANLSNWLALSIAVGTLPSLLIGNELGWEIALIPGFGSLVAGLTGWRTARSLRSAPKNNLLHKNMS